MSTMGYICSKCGLIFIPKEEQKLEEELICDECKKKTNTEHKHILEFDYDVDPDINKDDEFVDDEDIEIAEDDYTDDNDELDEVEFEDADLYGDIDNF